jgi:hypothetical protein
LRHVMNRLCISHYSGTAKNLCAHSFGEKLDSLENRRAAVLYRFASIW